MIFPWLANLLIAAAFQVVAYVITPKPKAPKPPAVQQAENPTAEAGKPIAVLFGTGLISELNVLGFWDKATRQYQVKV